MEEAGLTSPTSGLQTFIIPKHTLVERVGGVRVRVSELPSVGSGATLQERLRIKLQRREERTRDRQSRDTRIKTTVVEKQLG